jgi:hypothetical protein
MAMRDEAANRIAAKGDPDAWPEILTIGAEGPNFTLVALTRQAPFCAEVHLHACLRWRIFHCVQPRDVLKSVLRRLGLSPSAVEFEADEEGEIEIRAEDKLLAHVCFGASLTDLCEASARLCDEAWTPPSSPSLDW